MRIKKKINMKINIKLYEKNNRKKTGYVLLEAIVILMVVACISMMINKIVVNNYLKSKVVETREDIRTLSRYEEQVILESIEYFNNVNNSTMYTIENPNYGINKMVVDRSLGFLIKEKGNNKGYIKINSEKYSIDGTIFINIVPDFYKTKYMRI